MGRNGIAIGFITDGNLNVQWVTRVFTEITNHMPGGTFYKIIYTVGKDYRKKGGFAEARNRLAEIALDQKVKHIMWIDTDVFPPFDVVPRLLSAKKKLISGVYYMKTLPPQPVLYKSLGDGPYYNYPVNKVFKIDAAGFGCVLEDTIVLKKFEKEGIPFFKEDWVYKRGRSNIKIKIGEDYWHFIKSKELGVQPYCHSGVLCDHVDYKKNRVYPGEKEVERVLNKLKLCKK